MNGAGIDYALGAGGVTSPVWLTWVHQVSEVSAMLAAIGGAVLVMVRIAIAVKKYRRIGK